MTDPIWAAGDPIWAAGGALREMAKKLGEAKTTSLGDILALREACDEYLRAYAKPFRAVGEKRT